ncbi:MAG: acetyl-CoA carboxylase biotin carboxyl carrier protein subunit [Elusimicrobia bacterium]|jgi:biotin carboxyl carrier protein|nr:acetyl-CoA carboxylase biotin carboxyl carrier protein subunit [Elusimicrobiota bacterium]
MKNSKLHAVMAWLKTTDLAAVSYHDGSFGFELAAGQAPAAPPPGIPSCRYVPVCAPAVGVFQASAPGRAKLGEEGLSVKEGDALGQVETGAGQPHVVRSPCAGRVARVFASAGQAVQYGQPLFFLERG